ncbi:MAG TPA: hypothetical protein VKQ54_09145 [Caulobacteraceae bacterium]|nr:hypothetical protein [Caulobacteraceae bacterium]
MMRSSTGWLAAAVIACAAPAARSQPAAPVAQQTEADAYTRYELLAPGSGKFRILYEVTATTPGAVVYDNPIRRGSVASDERVVDMATGRPLEHETVPAAAARADGVTGNAADQYLRVRLARPVPPGGGGGRILIDKTYEDRASYRVEADGTLTFDRPLGIKRNTVVLPAGYELVACNVPSQVLQDPDGRVRVSFWNDSPALAPLVLKARPAKGLAAPGPGTAALADRAHQSRDIVYDLHPPETHAFSLYHDYTETKAGTDHYVNVVRAGSRVQDPGGRDLDTGAVLRPQVLKGEAIAAAGVHEEDLTVTPDAEVVVFHYDPVPPGGSKRLRMSETYVDAERYRIEGGELVWRRSFGRAHDVVILPAGWALSASSIPAVVTTDPDGRVRLEFTNPRPDEIDTMITAHRAR